MGCLQAPGPAQGFCSVPAWHCQEPGIGCCISSHAVMLQLDCMPGCSTEPDTFQPFHGNRCNFPAGILYSLSEVDANREQLFKTKNQQVLAEMIW